MYVGDAASHGLEIVVSGVQVLLKQVETWRKLVTDCLQDIGGQRGFRRRARRGHRKNFLPQGKKGLGRLGQREHLLSADLLLCKRREMLTRVTLHGSCLAAAWQLWRAIAEDRSDWRLRTHSRPMPPSKNGSCRVHGSKDQHCITQKDTQPSQTCSGEFIKTQLYALFVVVVSS